VIEVAQYFKVERGSLYEIQTIPVENTKGCHKQEARLRSNKTRWILRREPPRTICVRFVSPNSSSPGNKSGGLSIKLRHLVQKVIILISAWCITP